MANILLSAPLWTPLGRWNGTAFDIISISSDITLTAPTLTGIGDVISFNYASIITGAPPTIEIFADGVLFDTVSTSGASGTYTSGTLPTGASIAMTFLYDTGGYGYEITLSPAIIKIPTYVYEMEKGWSFDGNYIPHFLELNWFFGNDPTTYKGVQKIRVHGLSKGNAKLQVSTNGMETDYISDYSAPAYIDLPQAATFVTEDFAATTNYTNAMNRGLSLQMKFEGRNTEIALPEPAHVLQVLIIQSTPPSTGARAN